ncbi:MAG: dephospho-CoA kinase [Ruminococcaceae bacterium]|nr:dephospho-CoA kinase [Oscillospiraceae bacterium]
MSKNIKTKVIGLTGMSGAGKSTACKLFRQAGFEIIDCDIICREIVEKGKPCLKEISAAFGNEILTDDGSLNRPALGKIIFSDSHKRLKLNGIMYPYVSYSIIKKLVYSNAKYSVLDAPTLFESGMETVCDIIVSVAADKNILIGRIVKRDGISEELAEKRLDSQHDIYFYKERSDFLLMNNSSEKEFFEEVNKTINFIKESK